MGKIITIAIAGCGSRGRDTYANALLEMTDSAKVVAVADPIAEKREACGGEHGVKSEMRFETAEDMLAKPRLADVMLICTQDRQHVKQAIAAMEKGYDVLMEKPISPELDDLKKIVKVQRETGRKVVVCHVLRYTPFFREVKRIIDSGVLGEICDIAAVEPVKYWHQAHSFVRGNWRSAKETSPMIMQKCCHDLDYLVWLCGRKCERVSSFGSLIHFRPECAPEGAALRCMDGCKAKETCPYDAEKIYLYNDSTGVLKGNTDWPCNILSQHPDEASIREAIEKGPYGRCVYHCDNDVVDHQVVNMLMEGGATLSLTMAAFNIMGGRTVRVMGTMGELIGDIGKSLITVCEYGKTSQTIDVSKLSNDFSGHAGGDKVLLKHFLSYVSGEQPDSSITTLEASVESHLAALAAEESRLSGGKPIVIADMRG